MNESAAAVVSSPAVDPNACPVCKKSHSGSDAATLRNLARTPGRLAQMTKGLDTKGWAASYGPGKWNVRQIVCHLRDCELMFGVRWRLMLAADQPLLQAFDQDAWAGAARYEKQDAAHALATHAMLRASNLEMLRIAGASALGRVGRHSEFGELTIRQMARHLLSHDENHLGQLQVAKESWLAGRKRRRGGAGKRRSAAK